MIYSDGAINEGHWKNNKRYGMSHYRLLDGSSYVGNFENDIPNGAGTEIINNNSMYCGKIQ